MPSPPDRFWSRVRKGRLVQVLVVYLGASWAILEGVDLLRDTFELPRWVGPTAFSLLAVGLLVMLATAWVQSHPLVDRGEATDEIPEAWELDLAELKQSVAHGRLPRLTWARAILGGVFAFSLLFGFARLYVVIQDRGRSFAPEQAMAGEAEPGIAVFPFNVSGPDADFWQSVSDALALRLDGLAGLRVIDRRTLEARRKRSMDTELTGVERDLEVAREVGSSYALRLEAIQTERP